MVKTLNNASTHKPWVTMTPDAMLVQSLMDIEMFRLAIFHSQILSHPVLWFSQGCRIRRWILKVDVLKVSHLIYPSLLRFEIEICFQVYSFKNKIQLISLFWNDLLPLLRLLFGIYFKKLLKVLIWKLILLNKVFFPIEHNRLVNGLANMPGFVEHTIRVP